MIGIGKDQNDHEQLSSWAANLGVVQVILLGYDAGTAEAIDKALWMYSHRVLVAGSTEQAIRMCSSVLPDALVVATDDTDGNRQYIAEIRYALPSVSIIALSSRSGSPTHHELLGQGADAVLYRDRASIPVLNNVLGRLRLCKGEINWPCIFPPPRLPSAWQNTDVVGALVCDISGKVIDANRLLASWLGYASPTPLIGKLAWRHLLYCVKSWPEWREVTDQLIQFSPSSATVRGPGGQVLTMRIDVFSAMADSKFLHVTLLDQLQIQMLQSTPHSLDENVLHEHQRHYR